MNSAIQSFFTFDGQNRLSYGWASPNQAGAVIAAGAPLLWAICDLARRQEKSLVTQYLLWTAECVLVLLISFTYSRGAILGLIVGLVFYSLADQFASVGTIHLARFIRSVDGVRVSTLVAIPCICGLGFRLTRVLGGDQSVTNRLTVWRNGLEMMLVKPWFGWGQGESGIAHANWFQTDGSPRVYVGMVNSFLEIGVDHGLIGLFFVVFAFAAILCLFVGAARWSGRPKRVLLVGCAASIVVFLSCGLCSNLLTDFSTSWILILSSVFGFCSVVPQWSTKLMAMVLRFALVAASLCVGFVATLGSLVTTNAILVVLRTRPPFVLDLERPAIHGNPVRLVIIPDFLVLGGLFGRPIREQLLAIQGLNEKIRVYCPGRTLQSTADSLVFVLGARVTEIEDFPADLKSPVYLVCPACPVPVGMAVQVRILFLPEHDEIGFGDEWRDWARRHGCKVVNIPGVGQFIGHKWDDVVAFCVRDTCK